MKNPTEPNSPKKAIFYARVSSEGQVDNTSIDTQLDRGKAYAISQGWTLDRIFIDGGESGKSTDRTHFQEMIGYIRLNPVDVLLTFKLDRLSRNLKDLLVFIEGSQFDFDIQPDEAKVVEQVFKLYAQGNGYLKIKNITGCPLCVRAIAGMISNPFYAGKVRFGEIIENNNHQGIVSEKLFNKCQKVRESK